MRANILCVMLQARERESERKWRKRDYSTKGYLIFKRLCSRPFVCTIYIRVCFFFSSFLFLKLTSSKLVLPTPLAPKKAALSGPRYHCSLPSIVIRYAEYNRFCICICSIAANVKAAAPLLVPVKLPGDDRPAATTLLAP